MFTLSSYTVYNCDKWQHYNVFISTASSHFNKEKVAEGKQCQPRRWGYDTAEHVQIWCSQITMLNFLGFCQSSRRKASSVEIEGGEIKKRRAMKELLMLVSEHLDLYNAMLVT